MLSVSKKALDLTVRGSKLMLMAPRPCVVSTATSKICMHNRTTTVHPKCTRLFSTSFSQQSEFSNTGKYQLSNLIVMCDCHIILDNLSWLLWICLVCRTAWIFRVSWIFSQLNFSSGPSSAIWIETFYYRLLHVFNICIWASF